MAVDVRETKPGLLGHDDELASRVMFRISGLYGLIRETVSVPISPTESVDSGPTLMTLDPEADASANVGVADFEKNTLRMRNGVQLVFGGLHALVTSGAYDRALLNPPRGVSITDAKINPDYSGWEAQSCLDFLPGSMWSGAGGGWAGRGFSSLENNLSNLRAGRPAWVDWTTHFVLQWPEFLGGGAVEVDIDGSMEFTPILERV
jgi:hypothetical protein